MIVSVIVPLFNYARFLEANIESVLSQTITDWELIIVDDYSKDNPEPIVQKYIDQYPSKIKYFRMRKNKGYSSAKNYGIVRSSGEFIAHIDADDLLTPNSLEVRLRAIESKPEAMWCHGRAYIFKNKPTSSAMEEGLFKRWRDIENGKESKKIAWMSVHAQTVIVRRELYKKVGLYDEKMRFSADREMWRRIFNQGYWPAFVNSPVCHYRMHNEQMHKSHFKAKNKNRMLEYMNEISDIRKKGIDSSNTKMWHDEYII